MLFFVSLIFVPGTAFGGTLLRISDTLTNPAPSMMSSHTVQFTVTSGIPAGGRIYIAPDVEFQVLQFFDYTDVDFSVAASSGAPFIDRDLAASATSSADGVTVLTGTSSSFLITLRPGDSIASGSTIKVELGTIAKYGSIADQLIVNPTSEGTYRVDVETQTAGGTIVDGWNTLVALVNPIGVGPVNTVDDSAPIISNVLPPYGLLIAGGTQNVQIALNTNEPATCRYSSTSGTLYDLMTDFFDQTIPGGLHTVTVTGLVDGTTYDLYIVCKDRQNNKSVEYHEQFEIGLIPLEPGTGGIIGPQRETGDGVGGGAYDYGGPFLGNASVTLSGRSYPGSTVTILRDGVLEKKLVATSNGSFSATVENLARGTYTFGVYAEDSEARRSSTYTTTISVNADTGNTISRIYVPPTIAVSEVSVDPGSDLGVFGNAVPESMIEVFLGKQVKIGGDDVLLATTTVATNGSWEVSFNTASLSLETYEVKARTTVEGETDPGDFSVRPMFLQGSQCR